MKTGTCLRPSWTAIVCPTISGKIVDVRDQVRTICLLPDSFMRVMRLISRSSQNGAFSSPLVLSSAACADDQLVGFLVLAARALAERRHAPGRNRMPAALRLAL